MEAKQAGEILFELVQAMRIFRVVGQHQGESAISGTKVGVLQHLAQEDDRLTSLAAKLSVSVSVTSRAVDALEADGFVTRKNDPDDGRVSVISITEDGRASLDQRHRYIAQKFAQALQGLDAQDTNQMITVLQKLNTSLDDLAEILKSDEMDIAP